LSALLGQAALLLPWIFAPLALAAYRAARNGRTDERRWFCLALAVPGILLFTLTPVWGQTSLPHWAMPSWLFLVPLLGDMLAHAETDRRWPKIWAASALVGFLVLWTALISDAATGWIGRAWPQTFTKGDPTLESVDWAPLAGAVSGLELLKEHNLFVVSMKWNEAGRMTPIFWDRAPVVVFSDDPRGFGYTRGVGDLVGRDALIVVKPEDLGAGLDRVRLCFANVQPLSIAEFGRSGRPELQLHLFEGHRLLASCSELGKPSQAALAQWRSLKASVGVGR
jgi:hypothetical protein